MSTFTIEPQGRFSLREAVEFGFGQRHSERYAGSMRLAFVVDGGQTQAGVVLRQDDGHVVTGEITGGAGPAADPDVVRAQVARLLSLDHDAAPFEAVGARDPVVARLLELRPGLRPPLFHSPYEAAIWAVIATRRPTSVAARLREGLARAHGAVFDLDGTRTAAVPTPAQLLAVEQVEGIPPDRVERLRGVARFALDGGFDVDRLVALGPDEAARWVQQAPGVGPFYASLIVIRAVGFTDVLPTKEPRLLDLVRRLYELDDVPSVERFETLAQPWRPMRTWVSVLIRAAGGDAV